MDLSEHETASQHRYESLKHHIKKGNEMSHNPVNIFEGAGTTGGAGAAGLGGAGGAALGALFGSALGRNGLFGNEGNARNHVTPEQLQTSIAGVNDSLQNSMLMQDVGEVKAAIPVAEGQTQLALAQVQNALSNQIGQQSISLVTGFAGINQNISTAQAAAVAAAEGAKDATNAVGAATQLAIAQANAQGLQNTYAITTAVRDDGDKTRALIVSQNDANLQRMLAVAEAQLAENRANLRARETEINITNTNTATAQQLQTQNQQMQQFQILSNLAAGINNLANDIQSVRTTQSQIVFGNNTGSGQTSNATNNRVN